MRARLGVPLVSLVLVGLFLVGCGSATTSGGSATLAVTPPGPVSTVAGGSPISFGAQTTNTSETISWTLSPAAGVGTIFPTTGRAILYTPPANAGGPLVATLTATVSGASASATINLGPATGLPVAIPGLTAAVTVSYDERDIPNISCQKQVDCFAVQGYLHAHDRLFEMDILRRTAEGKLSEIIGSTELSTDLMFRTLFTTPFSNPPGQPLGEALVGSLDAQTTAIMTAYANGVNAYITAMKAGNPSAPFPAEYGMLLFPLSPSIVAAWTPADTLSIARLQQFELSETLSDEIDNGTFIAAYALGELPGVTPDLNKVNAWIRCQQPVPAFTLSASAVAGHGPVKASALKAPAMPGLGGANAGLSALSARLKALKRVFTAPHEKAGSNNWVVKGSASASGASMVANDPHLSLNYPPLFHLSSLSGDGLQVVGGTFPGIPGALIGRGAHVGWGVTVVGYDVTDVYMEQFFDETETTLAFGPGPGGKALIIPVPTTINFITPTGMQSEDEVILLSQFHGPIIGAGQSGPISMRWTGLEVNRCGPSSNAPCNPFSAFLGLLTATDVADAFVALANYDTGAQNFVLADDSGNIGFDPHAFVPQRPWTSNPNLLAYAPLPGTGVAEWGGADGGLWVADALLPQGQNPPKGYFATANSAPSDIYCTQDISIAAPFSLDAGLVPNTPYLSFYWDDPTGFRAGRIDERLAGLTADGGKVALSDMESIQTDHVATIAANFLPLLPAPASGTDSYGQAMALMNAWTVDGLNCPTGLQGTDPVASPPDSDVTNLRDSAGCLLFHAFLNRLLVTVFNDSLAAAGLGINPANAIKAMLFMLQAAQIPAFPQDTQSFCAAMDCRAEAQAAMAASFDQLTLQLGANQSNWLWGRLHSMSPQSLAFPLVAGFFNPGPYARPGGAFTVDVGSPSLRTDNVLSFPYGAGSNVRWIAVLNGSATKEQLPGPIIDGPTFPGSAGLLSQYVVNEYFDFPYGATAIGAATVRTQTFSP
jgi:penicillin G amidase